MTNEERILIKYRMERARETIDEADLMFEAGHMKGYINRLYYACFYAVSALLLTKNISTGKHGYLRSLIYREYVKTGVIPIELGKHFDLLFDSRLEGDYTDFTVFKADEVTDWLDKTRKFVNHIDGIITEIVKEG